MKIGFVILCYVNYNVVIKCIDSLKKLHGIDECEIVIVDNDSFNDAADVLEEQYKKDPLISIVRNNKNEGYAKGNNIGYLFLKKKDCDCVVVINSDAYIQNIDFIDILKNQVEKNAHIIAPDIVNRDGSHVNPGSKSNYNKLFFYKSIIKNMICLVMITFGIDYRKVMRKKKNIIDNRIKNMGFEYFIPHGSCIIFTEKWVNNEDRAFCEKTFLFFEERFLVAYCENKQYHLFFNDSLKILHDEDGSIQELNSTVKKKMKFVLKNQNQSLIKFISFINNPISNW